jgi:hypothetical protein
VTNGSIWPLLLSGVVGILLGGVVQVVVNRYVAFKEGQSIAAAIRAEVETLLGVWESAKFEEIIDGNIKHLNTFRRSLATPDDVFVFRVNPNPFQVFDSLCHKIGLLGHLSPEIVGFYGLGKALVTHLRTLLDIWERLLAEKIAIQREALLGQTLLAAQRYRDLQKAGPQVVTALRVYERRRWLAALWSQR